MSLDSAKRAKEKAIVHSVRPSITPEEIARLSPKQKKQYSEEQKKEKEATKQRFVDINNEIKRYHVQLNPPAGVAGSAISPRGRSDLFREIMKYLLLIESFHNTAQYRSYREGINC